MSKWVLRFDCATNDGESTKISLICFDYQLIYETLVPRVPAASNVPHTRYYALILYTLTDLYKKYRKSSEVETIAVSQYPSPNILFSSGLKLFLNLLQKFLKFVCKVLWSVSLISFPVFFHCSCGPERARASSHCAREHLSFIVIK